MKQRHQFLTLAAISACLFYSCQKDMKDSAMDNAVSGKSANSKAAKEKTSVGFVYTLSNEVSGNRVLAYSRSVAGTLTWMDGYATGGTGTGGGLGNQGAVTLTNDHKVLLAVNPGSNSVSSFLTSNNGLQHVSVVASGGMTPVSVTVHRDLVYVLNAGGTGNISGFRLYADGSLHPIAGSTRPLSTSSAGAAQVSFVQDGRVVAVTEKATNKIITYTIGMDGIPGMMHAIESANATPFGFAVSNGGFIYVSEAAGGAPGASTVSSYYISMNGMISLVDGPESAGQTAACWVVLTNNGKYVYATNTGSNTLTSFNADQHGELDILAAATAGMNVLSPIDAALTNNSKFIYVLNAGNESITALSVSNDGSLDYIQNIPGLPNGATGLAAK